MELPRYRMYGSGGSGGLRRVGDCIAHRDQHPVHLVMHSLGVTSIKSIEIGGHGELGGMYCGRIAALSSPSGV